MSTINTIPTLIQTAVAAAPANAEQIARRRATEPEEQGGQARQIREADEAHLSAVDEDEQEDESGANVRISNQLPEQSNADDQSPPKKSKSRKPRPLTPPTPPPTHSPRLATNNFKAAARPAPEPPLYQHVDLKA